MEPVERRYQYVYRADSNGATPWRGRIQGRAKLGARKDTFSVSKSTALEAAQAVADFLKVPVEELIIEQKPMRDYYYKYVSENKPGQRKPWQAMIQNRKGGGGGIRFCKSFETQMDAARAVAAFLKCEVSALRVKRNQDYDRPQEPEALDRKPEPFALPLARRRKLRVMRRSAIGPGRILNGKNLELGHIGESNDVDCHGNPPTSNRRNPQP